MQKLSASDFSLALKAVATPDRAENAAWFFKTGPGQYAEGDQFLGVAVPETRKVAKHFKNLPLSEIKSLLSSPLHEERLGALLILIEQFKKADEQAQKNIVDFVLAHKKYINNWDLVDGVAPAIIGPYFWKRDRQLLIEFAQSKNLWERRIAMISCFHFIRQKESDFALQIAEMLLTDKHDLMHKAVGWMLREIGKHCGREVLTQFLTRHYTKLPRTSLRYAIEHFPPAERKAWLKSPPEPVDPRKVE